MDIFDTEIIRFYRALQNSGVKYIVVGGYATNIQGYQRYKGDMDIWIEETKENRVDLRKAFNDIGMGDYFMMERMQFIAGWTDFRLNNGLRLDI